MMKNIENKKITLTAFSMENYIQHQMKNDFEHYASMNSVKTGYKNLDAITTLYPGLYVLGAISSLGKTTFALQMADQIAETGQDVIIFSLEQSTFELVSKSLARIMKKSNMEECFSSIEIRKQGMTTCVENTVKEYAHYAAHLTIVECSFETTLIEIINYVEEYIKEHNEKPVVIIDYLQVICARDHRMSTREVIDEHVRGLKQLQKNNELILLVISSLNRQNYTTAIDFESFKESGGIEYTADVLWGLQLDILHSKGFDKLTSEEKKEKIKEAKLESPRQIELVCVKNRSGQSRYSCLFNYYPEHDLYLPDGDDIWFDMLDDLEFPFK